MVQVFLCPSPKGGEADAHEPHGKQIHAASHTDGGRQRQIVSQSAQQQAIAEGGCGGTEHTPVGRLEKQHDPQLDTGFLLIGVQRQQEGHQITKGGGQSGAGNVDPGQGNQQQIACQLAAYPNTHDPDCCGGMPHSLEHAEQGEGQRQEDYPGPQALE